MCDDGQLCNGAEICDTTLGCQSGTPAACDDGDACTADVCDPSGNAGAGACDNSGKVASCAGEPCVGTHAFNAGDDQCGTADACVGGLNGATGACTALCTGADCVLATTGDISDAIDHSIGCVTKTLSVNHPGYNFVSQLYVRVDVNHTSVGDLTVKITSPQGDVFNVLENQGPQKVDTFNTYALSYPADFCRAVADPPSGVYTVEICDTVPGDNGTVKRVSVAVYGTNDDTKVGNRCTNAQDLGDDSDLASGIANSCPTDSPKST